MTRKQTDIRKNIKKKKRKEKHLKHILPKSSITTSLPLLVMFLVLFHKLSWKKKPKNTKLQYSQICPHLFGRVEINDNNNYKNSSVTLK